MASISTKDYIMKIKITSSESPSPTISTFQNIQSNSKIKPSKKFASNSQQQLENPWIVNLEFSQSIFPFFILHINPLGLFNSWNTFKIPTFQHSTLGKRRRKIKHKCETLQLNMFYIIKKVHKRHTKLFQLLSIKSCINSSSLSLLF